MRRRLPGILVVAAVLAWSVGGAVPARSDVAQGPQTAQAQTVALPTKEGSLKFGVIGDFGTGNREQYQLGEQMGKLLAKFPYEMFITVGDNLYGSQRPQDFVSKFEKPYKTLLDANVKFYASLGNHDDRSQARYKLFNMDGRRYYTFKAPKEDVRFFALESDYPLPEQIDGWKKNCRIPARSGRFPSSITRCIPRVSGTARMSPCERRWSRSSSNTASAWSSTGHDHFYERLKPQNGITYFVVGSSGKLREGNIDHSHRPDGQGIRHRSRLHGRRDLRRRDVFQHDFATGNDHRLRTHSTARRQLTSPQDALLSALTSFSFSFSFSLPFSSFASSTANGLPPASFQSSSNTSSICLTTLV